MRSLRPNRPRDDHAETGIGTMIVFIAAVLVAAVAAGVLISTTGDLQEKSKRTGEEATEQVSSNLAIEKVLGQRDNTTATGLNDMDIYVTLAPGAAEVALDQLKIQIQNGTSIVVLDYAETAAAGAFTASTIRDVDGSFSAATPVMTSGDLVRLAVDLDLNVLRFEPRDEVRLTLLPEVGNSIRLDIQTPNSFGSKTVVELG